jgi:hypothetical protein
VTATSTIHLAVVRLMRPIVGGQSIVSMIASDDPDLRRGALTIINTAWCVLAFAFLVAMVAVGIPVQVLAGDRAGHIVITILLGAIFFCLPVVRMCCGAGTGSCRRRVGGFVRAIGPPSRSTCSGRCRVTAASSFSPSSGS